MRLELARIVTSRPSLSWLSHRK